MTHRHRATPDPGRPPASFPQVPGGGWPDPDHGGPEVHPTALGPAVIHPRILHWPATRARSLFPTGDKT
jgi:hypothetical protein